jgi:hypothetical protein
VRSRAHETENNRARQVSTGKRKAVAPRSSYYLGRIARLPVWCFFYLSLAHVGVDTRSRWLMYHRPDAPPSRGGGTPIRCVSRTVLPPTRPTWWHQKRVMTNRHQTPNGQPYPDSLCPCSSQAKRQQDALPEAEPTRPEDVSGTTATRAPPFISSELRGGQRHSSRGGKTKGYEIHSLEPCLPPTGNRTHKWGKEHDP